MSAKENGVSGTVEKLLQVCQLLLKGQRPDVVGEADKFAQAIINNQSINVEVYKASCVDEFLRMRQPNKGAFNQLAAELPSSDLLWQLEELCGIEEEHERLKPYLNELWLVDGDKNQPCHDMPASFNYLPIHDAMERYKKIFGSSIKIFRVKHPLHNDSQGVAVWPTLSFLFNYYEIPQLLKIEPQVKPWHVYVDARRAYAKIVELLLIDLAGIYSKAGLQFVNFCDVIDAKALMLSPAGTDTWALLEEAGGDEMVASPCGARMNAFANTTCRSARARLTNDRTQFGQDAVMVAGTFLVQPELVNDPNISSSITCPATLYAPNMSNNISFAYTHNRAGFIESNIGNYRMTAFATGYW